MSQTSTPFIATFNGEERSSEEMIKDGWILQNDAGVEISPEQEAQIALKIQLHRDTHTRLSSFFSWKVSGERSIYNVKLLYI